MLEVRLGKDRGPRLSEVGLSFCSSLPQFRARLSSVSSPNTSFASPPFSGTAPPVYFLLAASVSTPSVGYMASVMNSVKGLVRVEVPECS